MPLKVTKNLKPQKLDYSRIYMKMIAVEFKQNDIETAKQYYRDTYKQLGVDLTRQEWEKDGDVIVVQTCELFRNPDHLVRIPVDQHTTLIFSRETFKINDQMQIDDLNRAVARF